MDSILLHGKNLSTLNVETLSSVSGKLQTEVTNIANTVDSASSGSDTGVAMLAVRNDALSSLTPEENDYVQLRVNSQGALWVTDSNTSYAEDVPHVSSDTGTFILGVRNDTHASLADTDGDYVPLQMNADGAIYCDITASGTITVDTELTSPALLSDAVANPTISNIASHGMSWNGTTWDRTKGDATDGLLVNLGSNNDVVEASASAIATSVSNVDTNTSGMTYGAGTETNSLLVTLASDSTGVLSVDDNGGSLTIDSTVLDAISTSCTSIDTKTSAITIGPGLEASAQLMTLASDSTGVLSVDDNGGSLTIDSTALDAVETATTSLDTKMTACDTGAVVVASGTITANLGTVDNAVLDSIVTNTTGLATEATLSTLDGKVTACDTGAVVIASGTVTANLGTVDNAVLDSIVTNTTGLATEATLGTLDGKVTACDTGAVVIASGTVTANLGTVDNAVLDSIVTNTSDVATETTLTSIDTKITACDTGAVVVASGTVTANLSAVDNAVLDSIDTNTTGLATEATLSTLDGKVTACNTGAVVVASGTVTANVGTIPVVGTNGNAWNNDLTGVLGDSNPIDCQYVQNISMFGTSDGATTLSLYASQDNINYYDTGTFLTLGGGGDFYFNSTGYSARYARIRSSATVTVTLTLAGK